MLRRVKRGNRETYSIDPKNSEVGGISGTSLREDNCGWEKEAPNDLEQDSSYEQHHLWEKKKSTV